MQERQAFTRGPSVGTGVISSRDISAVSGESGVVLFPASNFQPRCTSRKTWSMCFLLTVNSMFQDLFPVGLSKEIPFPQGEGLDPSIWVA